MLYFSDLKDASWQSVHFALPGQMDKVRDEIKNSTLTFVKCDVSLVKSDSELFDVLSKALDFPDYFGSNWDALEECLSDMGWMPANGYVLQLIGSDKLWKNATYTGGKLVSAWQSVAEQWSEEQIPFHLVFLLEHD